MDVLKALSIDALNPGACSGSEGWLTAREEEPFASVCPATGEPIARVTPCDPGAYDTLMDRARQTYIDWCQVPAPRRGKVVRRVAERLREQKDAWKAYMRRQSNTLNWGRELPLAQGIRFDFGERLIGTDP